MTVAERRIKKLKTENDRLKTLLDDPQEDLLSWYLAVRRRVDRLQDILDGIYD
jgi:hypothetical protein